MNKIKMLIALLYWENDEKEFDKLLKKLMREIGKDGAIN